MAEDVRQLIGRNVRRWRIFADLTQADLAALLDVDRSYVSGLERGQRNPTILTLWHVGVALGVSLAELVDPTPPASEE